MSRLSTTRRPLAVRTATGWWLAARARCGHIIREWMGPDAPSVDRELDMRFRVAQTSCDRCLEAMSAAEVDSELDAARLAMAGVTEVSDGR